VAATIKPHHNVGGFRRHEDEARLSLRMLFKDEVRRR
jgi:GMP synthase PP-ATPase subunit